MSSRGVEHEHQRASLLCLQLFALWRAVWRRRGGGVWFVSWRSSEILSEEIESTLPLLDDDDPSVSLRRLVAYLLKVGPFEKIDARRVGDDERGV
ncbi:hypothetical protein ACFLWA_13555 [Chloroflexota bacterium]